MSGTQDVHAASAPRRVLPWFYLTLAIVLGFFLLSEHRAHLFGALPFLLVLACPLRHVFMHKGHGNQGHGVDRSARVEPDPGVQP